MFRIIDWTGNPMFNQTFLSFDDAADYLSDKFVDLDDADLEETMQEYAIMEVHND